MKLFLIILIVTGAGGIGYTYQLKLQKEYKFLCFVANFAQFYNSNMTLFKNNVVDVIDEFVKQNKSSKFCEIFEKENHIYSFNRGKIDSFLNRSQDSQIIYEYLTGIGKNEYEFEKEKNLQFDAFLSKCKESSKKKLETKGSLYFKLALMFGAMLGIIIW